jgi:hypothetical protein
VKLFQSIYNWLRQKITFPSAFSWETLIVLSLFSYYMAILVTGWVRDLQVNFGWIFLILGVYWGTTASNKPPFRFGYKDPSQQGWTTSPWITGLLVSTYIFGIVGEGGRDGRFVPEMLIYWPIISAFLATVPDYIGEEFNRLVLPPPQKRKNHVLIFASQILLSCWFQFHYVVQDYLAQYPSIIADDFRKSAFVVKWDSPLAPPQPRGAELLDGVGAELRERLNGKRWSDIERLLLPQQLNKLVSSTEQQVKKRLLPTVEDGLWKVAVDGGKASARGSDGYNIPLRAVWQGPRAKPQPYSVTKNCQITPASRSYTTASKPLNTRLPSSPVQVSRFECQEVKGWGSEDSFIASE